MLKAVADRVRSQPEHTTVDGVYFRQVSPHHAPLWHLPLPISPQIQPEQRFNDAGTDYVQYMADSVEAAWAERVRHEAITTRVDLLEERRAVYALWIDELDIADLSDFDKAERCERGLAAALVGDEEAHKQLAREMARELRAAGFRGLIAPSAALPNSHTLALFGPRAERLIATPPPSEGAGRRGHTTIPCMALGIGGPPVREDAEVERFLSEVRQIGVPHHLYEEWARPT